MVIEGRGFKHFTKILFHQHLAEGNCMKIVLDTPEARLEIGSGEGAVEDVGPVLELLTTPD